MTDTIRAPWTEQQIAALNAYQRSGRMHPFTCGGQHELHQTLIAEADGWHCPDDACDYWQDWAHAFMLDAQALADMERARLTPVTFAAAPALTELAKVRQQLHDTERDLGVERQRTAELSGRLEALLIQTAIQRIPAQPPDPDGGLCDPMVAPAKPVVDVIVGEAL